MSIQMQGRIDWKKYAAVAIFVSAGLLAVWIFMKYGVHVLFPFLLAWVLSLFIMPLAERMSMATKIPRKLCSVLLLLISLALLVGAIFLSVNRLIREIEGLLRFLGEDSEMIEEKIQQTVELISNFVRNIPVFSALEGAEGNEMLSIDLGELVTEFFRECVSNLTARIPKLIGKVVAGVPQALLFLLVFLISSFYFSVDGDRIAEGIRSFLPKGISQHTVGLRRKASALLYRYLRVYLVLFLLTFTELLVGFTLLGRSYAFILAFVISALDVLPLLGVGSVLLPWSGFLFLVRDFNGAIGLLILWGFITVVRQIVEPRLIGESFGMHPLLALVSLYAGLKLFGFVGILIGPAVTVFAKLAVSELKKTGEGMQAANPPNARKSERSPEKEFSRINRRR